MTNKGKQRKVKQNVRPKTQKRKPTPFADAGAAAGQGLGKMFNMPILGGIGKWLGSGIGQIFGSGDYQMVGAQPSYNVLTSERQIPKFSNTERTNIVCHREYLGDLTGTAAFNVRSYPINPGMSKTFPWLSTVARSYSQYKVHGMIFEFRPLITDFVTGGAPGVLVIATNYNADRPVYRSKVEMENSEYAVSVKPTGNLMHGIECASNETPMDKLYVRSGAVDPNDDLRLYDLGLTQVATQGNPVQLLGELWVSYCVEFFKPLLAEDLGNNSMSQVITRDGFDNTNVTGVTELSNVGDIPGASFSGNTLYFTNDVPQGVYLMSCIWSADVNVVGLVIPSVPYSSGITGVNYIFNKSTSIFTSENTSTTRRVFLNLYFRLTHVDGTFQSIVFGSGANLPTGNTHFTMTLTKLDDLDE